MSAGPLARPHDDPCENDGLIWPRCDGLKWPHLVRSSADDLVLIEHGIEAAESGFQGGAVRADQA